MRYSRNSIWSVMSLALVIVSLLDATLGLAFANRRLDSPPRRHPAPFRSIETSQPLPSLSPADQQTKARIRQAFGRLPMRFETNVGQVNPQVRFISRGPGYSLFLTPTEAVMTLQASEGGSQGKKTHPGELESAARNPQSVVRMKLAGAHPAPQLEGLDALPGKSNYLVGNDQGQWRRNVTSYSRVSYQNVYPGIDLIYYGNQQQLEYDFVVAPGADLSAIRLSFSGMKKMRVDRQGDLVLHTANGDVRQRKPLIYQEVDGCRQEIAGRYKVSGKGQVGFQLANYDRTRPLVIDPVLAYSTYLGGSGLDGVTDIAIDAAGNAYLVGMTNSVSDFPLVNPLQPNFGGIDPPFFTPYDVFVSKLNRDGSALIYSTYLGGKSYDLGDGIAVDRDGNVCVTGTTISSDFPTKNALQPALASSPGNGADAFVAKLTADGSALVFSTFFGGSYTESIYGMAVDKDGYIYVSGNTGSTDFPTKNPLQPALAGSDDVFVAKMKPDGSALIYSTYLGGSNNDSYGYTHLAVDVRGSAYIAGSTNSTDFPTINALQATNAGGYDAFVAKLNPQGTALVYSTYLGGSAGDHAYDLALDLAGNAYVVGDTDSTNFPTSNPLQPALSGSSDAFVTKLNRTGSSLCYSTYLGGSDSDRGSSIAVDLPGRAYIIGSTHSADFPTLNAVAPKPDSPDGTDDAFVTGLNARGSRLIYSTYLGGRSNDIPTSITVDFWGNAYVAGSTASNDFPITLGAFQQIFKGPSFGFGGGDSFITKIENRIAYRAEDAEDEAFLRSQGCECTSHEK